ncbi:MAG TPA: UPF0182 family protein [Candidatus Limnocylindrales bacterium]|nr:UPF0182 family protein [Candidatus Limnocylindrales bacterium]
MRDMFDDFMDELRRRQAEAEGRDPDAPRTPDDEPGGFQPDDEPGGFQPADEPGETSDRGDDEPRPIRGAAGGAAGGPPRTRRPRRPRGPEGRGPDVRRALIPIAIGVVILVVFPLLGFAVDLWTDAIWFGSVGYDSVFWTRITTELWLFVGIFVGGLLILLANLWLAGRLAPPPQPGGPSLRSLFDRLAEASRDADARRSGWSDPFGGPGSGGPARARPVGVSSDDLPDLTPVGTIILVAVAVFLAITLAAAVSGAWETLLLWINRVPFAPSGEPVTDPVFGRDVSFFLFELPFLRLIQSVANTLIIGALLVAGGRYLVAALRSGGFTFPTPVRVHLAVLGGLYLVSVAVGYQLDKFELVYSANGVATGISYADQASRFFAFDALTIIAGLAAALLVGGAFTRMIWPLGGALVIWFGASVLLGAIYPEVIQRFVVTPNPYANEEPYIRYNIAMTRLSYDLLDWERRDYNGDQPLTAEDLEGEAETFGNARLWDYRPLRTTIDQLQTVRQYYDFLDVDTDRYDVDGERRQVMLSGRELDLAGSRITQNWLNTRIIYTHGVGAVMVPVNEVVGQGQPRLWIRDLPPVSSDGAPEITQPRIYFGELTSDYIIVGARQPEFDFPSGTGSEGEGSEQGAEYRWTGSTGINIDSTLTRLLFALRFRDLNLLISDQVTSESQLLFHRSIADRLPRIAPFLRYDRDPYLVVKPDGGLVFIQDAYTVSDRFPNAEYFFPTSELEQTSLGSEPFNYIRNSVKVVMDAYDGTTTFYVADSDDALIRAYQGVFPELFRPLDQLPEDLVGHLRYPEEQFNVQARVFGRYHVTNPLTFFQNDDLWTVPTGTTSEQTLPSEAYYVIMRAPGEESAEFLLLQPMVPRGRPNMIAWVAAGNDPQTYGQVRFYQFPANTTVFGPAQVEALIDQDPIISSQITLWSQAGSQVIRGNLLVVPVQDSIVYLQPVYLQSTGSSFPEFQRIVVASPTSVVWADTLREALGLLLEADGGIAPPPSPGPSPTPGASPSPGISPTPGPTPPSGDVQALIEYANFHFELAQQALRAGDFATYGAEMDLVEAALAELTTLVGTPPPQVSPSPSPVP